MGMPTRQAALCLFRNGDEFLFVELTDPKTGGVFHRPPGGGMELGETPQKTVRRELLEELGLELRSMTSLGLIDHEWFCDGRDVQERAWIFLADASDYPDLLHAATLLEADGQVHRLVWRKLAGANLPPVCPIGLPDLLQENSEI